MPEFISILRWIRDIVYPQLLETNENVKVVADNIEEVKALNTSIEDGVLPFEKITTTTETIDSLSTLNASDGDTVIVKDLNRGGTFIYDATKSDVNNGGTIFDGWVRQYSGAVNVKWFGANETRLDNEVPIQLAIDSHKSIFIPDGKFKISASIILSQNIFEIKGIKGKSILMGTGGGSIFGYFAVTQQYYADFGIIDGITFDSDDHTKSRWAIYSPSDVYLSHCKISECNFNGRLTGGIIANLIACHIYRCYFGVYFAGAGNSLKAIASIGSVSAITTTNINVIEQCEFASCGSPQSIVEFVTGHKVVFRDCIFEQLTPTATVVLLTGISFPVFEGCWFENAQGTTESGKSTISTRTDGNGIICEVLTVTDCLFHTYTTIPNGLINMGDSIRKHIEFSKNFLVSLQSPIVVGGNSVAKFINSFGNTATVGSGGDATGLQYDSPAKFDLGLNATSIDSNAIIFPATQVSSSNVNTLDDYQEGKMSPIDNSGAGLTLANSSCIYTKIGNSITFSMTVVYPTTVDTLPAVISFPPFSTSNDFSCSKMDNSGLSLQVLGNSSGLNFYTSGSFTPVTNAQLSEKILYISGSYLTST